MVEPESSGVEITDEDFRKVAVERWCNEKLQIDDNAEVSESDAGAWVQVWVWVGNQDVDSQVA